MTGFTDLGRVEPKAKGKAASSFIIADLSSEEIERSVHRGRQIRSAHLAVWGRRMFETWKSLFRRPGRMVVTTGREASA